MSALETAVLPITPSPHMPALKTCAKCLMLLPASEFNFRSQQSGSLQSKCRTCQNTYNRSHYRKNKKAYYDSVKRTKRRLQSLIREAKDVPCHDCGVRYPYFVMQFDHLDPDAKINDVSRMVSCGSPGKLLDEIAKCEVVCANCHAYRTHSRL